MRHPRWFRPAVIAFLLLTAIGTTVALLYQPLLSSFATANPTKAISSFLTSNHPVAAESLDKEPIALGAFIPGEPQIGGPGIDAYSQLAGKTPAVVMWYASWPAAFDASQLNPVIARGAVPMISMNPYPKTHFSDAQIASGAMDAYLHEYAHNAATWGKPLYYRFAWEMNGCWMHFSPCAGNTNASYVAMWQHVHDIFQQEGATNVRWVWCPNDVVRGVAPDFTPLYPGDAYVDYVALDGYNWGTSHPGHKWHSFADEFSSSYHLLTSLTNKPVMIGETSSAEVGGNKADWITQAFFQAIPALFPRIKCVIWFNMNKETDWLINSSPAALQAFRQVVASPLYQGKLGNEGGPLPPPVYITPIGVSPNPTPGAAGNPGSSGNPGSGGNPDPTGTPAPTTASSYTQSFEDGTIDNWSTYGAGTTLQASTNYARDGKYSLQVSYQNTSSSYHHASVSSQDIHVSPQPGQTLTAYLYVPTGSQPISAHIYIVDGDHNWNAPEVIPLGIGQWNQLTYVIPNDVKTPIYDTGIQFVVAGGQTSSGAIYIDSIQLS